MSITVLPDLIFRHGVISSTIKGRLIRKNQRVTTASGYEFANIVWDRTLREYEFDSIPLRREDWEYFQVFHELTEGGALGFLLEDPQDYYTTDTTTYTITSGVMASLGGGTYQLFKRYKHVATGRYKDRKITRVNASTFQAFASGGSPLTGSVDPDTGIATITGTPATWTGRFYVPVHFQSDEIDWQLAAPGPEEARFLAGTSILLQEIRE